MPGFLFHCHVYKNNRWISSSPNWWLECPEVRVLILSVSQNLILRNLRKKTLYPTLSLHVEPQLIARL